MPDIHALLSASSSNRWLECPKSVALEAMFPETDSPYALEGTRAHEMAQLILENLIHQKSIRVPNWIYKEIPLIMDFSFQTDNLKCLIETNGTPELKEMLSFIMVYIDTCVAVYENSKANYADTVAIIECRLDYSYWAPEGFGTGDFVCIGGNRITVIDLKYGRGVKVSVEDNSQLKLYSLGAYSTVDSFYEIEEIENIIVQPRIASGISYSTFKVKDLLDWGNNYLRPRAHLAFNNLGDFHAGSHCKFCKASGQCRAQAHDILNILKKYGGKQNG